MNAAAIAPGIVLGLFAAHAIDRVRRRPVLIGADLVRAGLLLALPLAAFSDVLAMAHVVAFAFCRGLFDFVFGVAEQSYLPVLVPPRALVRANGGCRRATRAPGRGLRRRWLARAAAVGAAGALDRLGELPGLGFPARGSARSSRRPRAPAGWAGARAGARSPRARDRAQPRAAAITAAAVLVPPRSKRSAPCTCCSSTASSASRPGRSACCSRWARSRRSPPRSPPRRVLERLAGLPVMVAGLAVCARAVHPGPRSRGDATRCRRDRRPADRGRRRHVLRDHQRSCASGSRRPTCRPGLGAIRSPPAWQCSAAPRSRWLGGAGLRATLVAGLRHGARRSQPSASGAPAVERDEAACARSSRGCARCCRR